MKDFQAKDDIKRNIWPMFIELLEALLEEFGAVSEALDELLEDEGSVIQPELAVQIIGTLKLAQELAERTKALTLNDIDRKQIGDLAEALIKASQVTEVVVEEAAIEPDEPEPEDDDGGEEDDTADGDDAEEPTKPAAVKEVR